MSTPTTDRPRLDLRSGSQRVFAHVLASSLVVSVANFTVWFAVTFWTYLETRSVLATGLIAGIFLVATAATGIWFGSLVDHHRKQVVIQASAVASFVFYALALGLYLATPETEWRDAASPLLWVFVVVLMLGVISGNLRGIALPTLVTLLVPEPVRDRANGLVGTTSGVSFLVTSVISGLLVAFDGMRSVLVLALVVMAGSFLHVSRLTIPEPVVVSLNEDGSEDRGVDLRGTFRLVRGVPGLLALIVFSCFNNFLGGTFMALMDAYGLSLVSVQAWGLLWGVLSAGVIIGGLMVARTGVGANPVRTLLLVNVALWTTCVVFPLRSSIVLLAVCDDGVHVRDAVRRGVRADGPPARGALPPPGPGLRLRPEHRAGRVAPDRVPDRPDHPAARHPVDDRRLGRRGPRALVRHRPRPRHRARVRGRRDHRAAGHRAGPAVASLPPAVGGVRRGVDRARPRPGDLHRRLIDVNQARTAQTSNVTPWARGRSPE